MKLKRIFYLSIIFTLFLKVYSFWDADELVNHFPNESIIDPNNYFLREIREFNNIKENIEILKKEFSINTYVYMINTMDKSVNNNPRTLADRIAYVHSKGDLAKDKNSLIILMSIEDRKNTIRTGKAVKDLIGDSTLSKNLNEIKKDLREKNYTKAIDDLLNRIISNIRTSQFISNNLFTIIFWIFIIAIGIFLVCLIYHIIKERKTKSRIERIKEITKKNISREAFIDENCTICLEEFTKEELDSLKKFDISQDSKEVNQDIIKENSENDINQNQEFELINIEQKELRNRRINSSQNNQSVNTKENTKEIKEKKEKEFIAKLNCGHIFHSKCIEEWMKKSDKCPLCKKGIEDESTNSNKSSRNPNSNTQYNSNRNSNTNTYSRFGNLAEELINIQRNINPSLNNYDFTYQESGFSYRYRYNRVNFSQFAQTVSSNMPKTNFNTNEFRSFTESADAGGASSDW